IGSSLSSSFVFSSRRRHTRLVSDWSSDVCSSDLSNAPVYSPTSNPATYTGAFELIRQLFAQLPEAKLRGYSARRFSFNVPGGRRSEERRVGKEWRARWEGGR